MLLGACCGRMAWIIAPSSLSTTVIRSSRGAGRTPRHAPTRHATSAGYREAFFPSSRRTWRHSGPTARPRGKGGKHLAFKVMNAPARRVPRAAGAGELQGGADGYVRVASPCENTLIGGLLRPCLPVLFGVPVVPRHTARQRITTRLRLGGVYSGLHTVRPE